MRVVVNIRAGNQFMYSDRLVGAIRTEGRNYSTRCQTTCKVQVSGRLQATVATDTVLIEDRLNVAEEPKEAVIGWFGDKLPPPHEGPGYRIKYVKVERTEQG